MSKKTGIIFVGLALVIVAGCAASRSKEGGTTPGSAAAPAASNQCPMGNGMMGNGMMGKDAKGGGMMDGGMMGGGMMGKDARGGTMSGMMHGDAAQNGCPMMAPSATPSAEPAHPSIE